LRYSSDYAGGAMRLQASRARQRSLRLAADASRRRRASGAT